MKRHSGNPIVRENHKTPAAIYLPGQTLLVVNMRWIKPASVEFLMAVKRYTRARKLEDSYIFLSRQDLHLKANTEVSDLKGGQIQAGPVEFRLASITFLADADVGNGSWAIIRP